MSTWSGVIVETKGVAGFWDVARNIGVRVESTAVPAYILIETDNVFTFGVPQLAEKLSREIGGMCIGFFAQTSVDVHLLHCFDGGAVVRRLGYSREGDGWFETEGPVQSWERHYFFDDRGSTSQPSDPWPDMLDDDISDEDIERYNAAKLAADPTLAIDLLHPSSTWPLTRLCNSFGIAAEKPAGRWTPPGTRRQVRAWIIGTTVAVALVGMFLLGALTKAP